MPLTKEQAINHAEHHGRFVQKRAAAEGMKRRHPSPLPLRDLDFTQMTDLPRPKVWRVTGKPKTWKRDPDRFQIPIRYGMYEHGYVDQDNIGLFELE